MRARRLWPLLLLPLLLLPNAILLCARVCRTSLPPPPVAIRLSHHHHQHHQTVVAVACDRTPPLARSLDPQIATERLCVASVGRQFVPVPLPLPLLSLSTRARARGYQLHSHARAQPEMALVVLPPSLSNCIAHAHLSARLLACVRACVHSYLASAHLTCA